MNQNKIISDFYNKLININNVDIELEIKNILYKYKDVDKEGMCKVLCRQIYYDLLNKHIPRQLINTKDLGFDYEHEFILCKYYENGERLILIDLTFEQFVKENNKMLLHFDKWSSDILSESKIGAVLLFNLLNYGYAQVDKESFKLYLSSLSNGNTINNISFLK